MQFTSLLYIIFDMANYRYQLPSMSTLSAFECAGRHGNFSRAAVELNSSQPAISRHIAGLEQTLGIKLFDRKWGRVTLTPDGQRFYHAVVSGMEEIAVAARDIRIQPQTISIACSHAISHLWLMPRYDQLQEHLGEKVEIVTVTSEYEYHPRLQEEGIDINLTFAETNVRNMDKTVLFEEEIFPVCAPAFARDNEVLIAEKGAAALAELPLLYLGQRNYGWATWDTWFENHGIEAPESDAVRRFGNYVYLLEAACNDGGIALGWSGLVESYLTQGRLVQIPTERLSTGGKLYLVVNPLGRNPSLAADAAACLSAL